MTDPDGYSIRQAIFSGCKNEDSKMGVFAGSPDSYTTFEPLFRPIIQDYHDYDGSKRTNSNLDFTEWQFPEWTKERVTKVYGIQMRISRNL